MASSSSSGHILADHRRGLEQPLVFGREPVDASSEDGLDRRRDAVSSSGRTRRYAPRSPASAPALDERLHALLEEERVALGPVDQAPPERRHGGVGVEPEEVVQQLVGAGRGQWIDPQLRVERLAPPGVLVLGTVVHQKAEPRRREALDESVEAAPESRRRPSAGPRTRAAAVGPGPRGARAA